MSALGNDYSRKFTEDQVYRQAKKMLMWTHFLGFRLQHGCEVKRLEVENDCFVRTSKGSEEGKLSYPENTLENVGDALPEIAKEQLDYLYMSELIRYLEQGTLPEDERLARRTILSI